MYYIKKQINNFQNTQYTKYIPGLVSAIIPVYSKKTSLLPLTLKAVDGQNWDELEIIVVYDPFDGLESLISESGVFRPIVRERVEKNLGAAYARNRGAIKAHGEFFWFVDSDVIAINGNALREAVSQCRKSPEIGITGGVIYVDEYSRCFNVGGYFDSEYENNPTFNVQVEDNYVNTACALVPRRSFLAINGFTEYIEYMHDDVDFGLKMRAANYKCIGNYKCSGEHPAHAPYPTFIKEFMSFKNSLLTYIVNSTPQEIFEIFCSKVRPSVQGDGQTQVNRQRNPFKYRMLQLSARIVATLYLSLNILGVIRNRADRQTLMAILRKHDPKKPIDALLRK